MKKNIFTMVFCLCALMGMAQKGTIYQFKVTDIDGKKFSMAQLKGKKVLIVNVASECGLTPQYQKLQELYAEYESKGFVVIGFPSNDFKGQEPGTNEQIKTFCVEKYKVNFPMMSKVTVVGENKAPIYEWLTKKSKNGVMDCEVQWNFQKFMIDRKGKLVDFAPPREDPMSDHIVQWILDGK